MDAYAKYSAGLKLNYPAKSILLAFEKEIVENALHEHRVPMLDVPSHSAELALYYCRYLRRYVDTFVPNRMTVSLCIAACIKLK